MAENDNEKNPKAEYAKSTAQLDAERRAEALEAEGKVQVVDHFRSVQPTYGVATEDGYLGTDPVYQNAADERQAPLEAEGDWQAKLATADLSDAGKENLPYVEGHLGTGAPKVVESGPVTSTSTVAEPVRSETTEPGKASTTTAAPSVTALGNK